MGHPIHPINFLLRTTKLLLWLWLIFLGATSSTRAETTPDVVVTLKPLHSIAFAVMEGVAKPRLIIDGLNSPHGFAIKTSQIEGYANADLFIWASSDLEKFMPAVLQQKKDSAAELELIKIKGLDLLPARTLHHWDKGNGPKITGAHDPNFWLSPDNAKKISRSIASTLSKLDPENAETYKRNASSFSEKLSITSSKIIEDMSSTTIRPYIVFLDAYQYFENSFGVSPIATIIASADENLTSGHLDFLRKKISDTGNVCVFFEPQFSPQAVDLLVDGKSSNAAPLDPLGVEISKGSDHYGLLIQQIARSILECHFPG